MSAGEASKHQGGHLEQHTDSCHVHQQKTIRQLLEDLQDKKDLMWMSLPQQIDWLNIFTWSAELTSYHALIAANSNAPCHRRWACHSRIVHSHFDAALLIMLADTLVCATKVSQSRELMSIFLLGFSATVPCHDSSGGCRSSYISPSERLVESRISSTSIKNKTCATVCLTALMTTGETPAAEMCSSGP